MFFRVFEGKIYMRKADDSRRTKKYPQKKVRNLAKAKNENSISIKEATTQAKKPATLKKLDSLSKKQSKQRLL